jgi:multidrug efflux pump subunit AcrA (membrane-fusion protein)
MLLPNINVDVAIEISEGSEVPALPREVVLSQEGKTFVWVVQEGRAARRYVGTGRSTLMMIEITEGLSLGDRVIVPGADLLSEGSRVRNLNR